VRSFLLIVLAVWLALAGTAFAQSDDTSSDQSSPDQAPAGPVLQPSDVAPPVCDPSAAGFRYLEVRGTGFDAWATQHLVGSVVDANGAPQIQWSSIWVSPQGNVTLEVNLCSDPFSKRPALAAGDYTVAVAQGNGAPIASTGFSLGGTPPGSDQGTPDLTAPAAPTPSAATTPFFPTPTPRTGLGSVLQPYPLGTQGNLADGWQLGIVGITPDAYATIKAAVPSAIQPPTGQNDYMVRIQATYAGQGTGVFSASRLALVTNTQTQYDQLRNSCGPVPDAVLPNVVTQGTVILGNICFVVPTADIGSLTLFDNQTSPSDQVYFKLT
jgi:hypothetical protein